LVSSYTTPSPSHIYTLSLHDALPISEIDDFVIVASEHNPHNVFSNIVDITLNRGQQHSALSGSSLSLFSFHIGDELRHCLLHHTDRKSTRLNSSHVSISYAVFCLKKK